MIREPLIGLADLFFIDFALSAVVGKQAVDLAFDVADLGHDVADQAVVDGRDDHLFMHIDDLSGEPSSLSAFP